LLFFLDFLIYEKLNHIVSTDISLNFLSIAREISKIGDLLNMDVCMEILDILYETEDSSWLFNSPCQLAASALVCYLMQHFVTEILYRLLNYDLYDVSFLFRLLHMPYQFLSRDGSSQSFLGLRLRHHMMKKKS
jgi:hypothetical protein